MITQKQKGFTLIELLVVIGILAILLAIVLIALNPQQNFRQANNVQRRSNVNAILNAIHQSAAQNKGVLPASITSTAQTIASTGTGTVNLCADLVPTYIADLPLDPTTGTETPAGSICSDASATYNTGYTVQKSAAGNRITVSAPAAENGEIISVTR